MIFKRMNPRVRLHMQRFPMIGRRVLPTVCFLIVAVSLAPSAPPPTEQRVVPAVSPYIDAHTHFDERDPEGSIRAIMRAFPRQNMVRACLLISPDTTSPSGTADAAGILAAAKSFPGKLAVLAGGEILNSMIQQSVRSGDTGAAIQRKFRERAEELLRMGQPDLGKWLRNILPAARLINSHHQTILFFCCLPTLPRSTMYRLTCIWRRFHERCRSRGI